jgi:uncharacterized protein YndB with AHSA1/START domain
MALLAAAPAPVVVTRVILAPPAAVYEAFTTRKGLETFLAPQVNVSLAKDGPFEAFFDLTLPAGMKGSEGCVVRSWTKDKRFAFTWNFPPSLPSLRTANARTDVEVTFEPDGPNTTVTLTQTGWKDGADWHQGAAYFTRAWGFVLARLARVMVSAPIDWKHPWRPMKVKELAFLNGAFRERTQKAITEETWLIEGDSGGMWARERELTNAKTGPDAATLTEVGELEQAGDEIYLTLRLFGVGLAPHPKDRARFVLEALDDSTARFVETKKGGLVLTYRREKDLLQIELEFPKGTERRTLQQVLR